MNLHSATDDQSLGQGYFALRRSMMNALPATSPRNLVRLTDSQMEPFLKATPGVVVVDVSTKWCAPCRLLAPVMHKLAAEFAGWLTVVELDGDEAGTFAKGHAVESYPTLLFFRDGNLIHREEGFGGLEAVVKAVKQALGMANDGDLSAVELAFRDAHTRARAHFNEVMEAAYQEVAPHLKAIGPELDALEARYKEDRKAGRISEEDASRQMHAHFDRLCEPFADKLAAMDRAQEDALAVYENAMHMAIGGFTGPMEVSTTTQVAQGTSCRPDDPFCAVAR
jgi:thioredoxin 1